MLPRLRTGHSRAGNCAAVGSMFSGDRSLAVTLKTLPSQSPSHHLENGDNSILFVKRQARGAAVGHVPPGTRPPGQAWRSRAHGGAHRQSRQEQGQQHGLQEAQAGTCGAGCLQASLGTESESEQCRLPAGAILQVTALSPETASMSVIFLEFQKI